MVISFKSSNGLVLLNVWGNASAIFGIGIDGELAL